METTKRIEWIDQYRGLLFLFVIMCHTRLAAPWMKNIYEPIFLTGFFFLSGYLYKDKPIVAKLKSLFNGLVAPFLLYSLLWGGGHSWLHTRSLKPTWDTIVDILAGGDTIWFIPCLILVELIYILCRKCLPPLWCNGLLGLFGIISLFVTTQYTIDFNLWCWQTAVFAVGCYAMGEVCKNRLLQTRKQAVGCVILYIALCLGMGAMGWLNGIDIHFHKYGNPLAFLPLSVIGCYASVSLIRFLPTWRYLSEFGRYTLFMFPFHSIALRHVSIAYGKLTFMPDWVIMLLIVATTSIIMLFLVRYVYRYVPAMGGKKKWI